MKYREPLAMVGLGAVLPGAFTLPQFWQNLIDKKSTVQPVPDGRWSYAADEAVARPAKPDHVLSKYGCFVPEFVLDRTGLDLPWDRLESQGALDPLYSFALQAAREAWLDQRFEQLDRQRVGVILAAIALPTHSSSNYTWQRYAPALAQRLSQLRPDWGVQAPAANPVNPINTQVTGLPASIVARALGLGGGSYSLDAACASSLYSFKLACDELDSGRLDAVLAGGVSRPDSLYTQQGFTALGAISPSGRCSPFDVNGDGLVVGEGSGVVVLKRLSTAIAHGDRIYGLIRSIGLSNDIGGSLLAPDTEGQLRAMHAAYNPIGWAPEDIQIVECHGTGTPMGDKIEIRSLRALWENRPWTERQCAIGSVKSMIGHLLTGAGAAGMIKVLLGMQNQTLPPSINFTSPHPSIPLQDGPFRVQQEAQPWEAPSTRKAAISAFGFGGVNAHVLIEEYQPSRQSFAVPGLLPSEQGTPLAIVGIGLQVGSCHNVRQWADKLFDGLTLLGKQPKGRWGKEKCSTIGAYLEQYSLELGAFKIPPRDIPIVLPQQTLMLEVAAQAAKDANISRRQRAERAGVLIGLNLDMDTNDFHLRWALPAALRDWAHQAGVDLSDEEFEQLLAQLRAEASDALDSTRTLGALGSIVSSRVARELNLGGPSFSVSSGDASACKALEIGCRALQRQELDWVMVAAIDFTLDPRSHDSNPRDQATSLDEVRPFQSGSRSAAGEGAVALVIKRLEDCGPNDRVYSVIRGLGSGSDQGDASGQGLSVLRAHQESQTHPSQVSLVQATGYGLEDHDLPELAVLQGWYGQSQFPDLACAIHSLTWHSGMTGASSGLFSLAAASLQLARRQFAPIPGFVEPLVDLTDSRLHFAQKASHWLRNRDQGPRLAAVHHASDDGNSCHIVLEQAPQAPLLTPPEPTTAIFGLAGGSHAELCRQANELQALVQQSTVSLHQLAVHWWKAHPEADSGQHQAAIVTSDFTNLQETLRRFEQLTQSSCPGHGGLFYSQQPLAKGEVAFVFPGSGNHYAGMGRELALYFPEIALSLDESHGNFGSMIQAPWIVPYRSRWNPGWEQEANDQISSDLHRAIFGQIMVASLASDILRSLGVEPQAAIGYSLGESASLVALRSWIDSDGMYHAMESSTLFREDLGGPCTSARIAFGIPDDQEWHWTVVLLAHPVDVVRPLLDDYSDVALMIVNTDNECVVGGGDQSIKALAERLGGKNFFLEGIPAVHCKVVEPVREAYRDLHLTETVAPPGIRFYSAYRAESYIPTRERAALAIEEQGLYGLDFTKVIRRAYKDGVRYFVEMGPGRSCSRMTSQILKSEPHLTRAINAKTESEFGGLLKLLGQLYSERLPGLQISRLYAPENPLSRSLPVPSGKASVEVQLGSLLPRLEPATSQFLASRPSVISHSAQLSQAAIPLEDATIPDHETRTLLSPIEAASIYLGSMLSEDAESTSPNPVHSLGQEQESHSPTVLDDWNWPDLTEFFNQADGAEIAFTSSGGSTMSNFQPQQQLPIQLLKAQQATAEAHEVFLRMAQQGVQDLAAALKVQSELLSGGQAVDASMFFHTAPLPIASSLNAVHEGREHLRQSSGNVRSLGSRAQPWYNPFCDHNLEPIVPEKRPCVLDYDQCMEFAVGSIAKVLGPQFADADTYPTRVRLPDDPLMLVHRITAIEGEALSLGAGRLVTEHDVQEGAWYLDNRRMPVCVSVEAGQADLFLSAYLGIDLKTKGQRVYRLLDATVSFHRRLPTVGETISYDIRIDRFVRQGETYLFFFEFDGTINGQPFITMRNGCAGFFTYEEIKKNKGVILTAEEKKPEPGKVTGGYRPLVAFDRKESYSDEQVRALWNADLPGCFGSAFAGLALNNPPCLPSGRLKLFDRILEVDPKGGRFGLGSVRAEADGHPDDWFLTCHFVDDKVMPGTLMYECCAYSLRFLLFRMGWVGECDQITYEPLLDRGAALRCRGPVDVTSKKVVYEVEIKEIGYGPEPYVITDALMYCDGKCIVRFVDMSLRLVGLDKATLEQTWAHNLSAIPVEVAAVESKLKRAPLHNPKTGVTYDQQSIYEFAEGKPSLAFGTPYTKFDQGTAKLARLPRAPFSFVDRIVEINAEPFVLEKTEWIEAQYDVPRGEWYFDANRQTTMPFAILLETALQPCGWLAAYCGSGLRSELNLKFRNLGGKATLHREIHPDVGTLAIRVRMPKVSEAGGMIIEDFEMQMLDDQGLVYEGTTYFGFFTEAALANQVGIRDAKRYQLSDAEKSRARRIALPKLHPTTPDDTQVDAGTSACMPGHAMLMLDEVDLYVADGGPKGLGYLHGIKAVNPDEWFFQAHFFEDPVCPGSLGLEAFLQLLKVACLEKFPQYADTHRFEAIATGVPHTWGYRGQVIPKNKEVVVEACLTEIIDDGNVLIKADGFLVVDGKPIYSMNDFSMRMVRA
jgi:PfaB family protein